AHAAACAMRARFETVGRALAAHNIRLGAHAARDNAELTGAGTNRALARDPHLLAEMPLALDIVMVAIDGRAADRKTRHMTCERCEYPIHHHFAVARRVALRPIDCGDIVVE